MLREYMPKPLAKLLANDVPFRVAVAGRQLDLTQWTEAPGRLECRAEGLTLVFASEWLADLQGFRYTLSVENSTAKPIEQVEITPLLLRLSVDPKKDAPRVRHISGSNHYDGTYPPRAFRVSEERYMTHDHCKPVIIGSTLTSGYDHVPVLEFAVGPHGGMSGLFVSFEWSCRWELWAGWETDCYFGQPCPDFLIRGTIGLKPLTLDPGERIDLPRVHMGFSEGGDFGDLDNVVRRYAREAVACKLDGRVPTPPVYYDHWFGIHQHFDLADMKRQADAAVELGCEIFILDAAWYEVTNNFADGIGNWFHPDPKKFPNGVEELSEYVRGLGMKFGMWHMIEMAVPGTHAYDAHPDLYDSESSPMAQDPVPESPTSLRRLRLDKPEGRAFALDLLRKWVVNWKVSFIRWESSDPQRWAFNHDPSGKLSLAYMKGFYEIIDTLRAEFPQLYIECCEGGGTRLDWGMAARTHCGWLSDHTAHQEVSRFFQAGASRFWPAHFLTSAVRVHRGAGDIDATSHNLLCRMMGPLSFNGDISQWTPVARALAKEHVRAYKELRHFLAGPIHFPLPQPRSDRDWDAIVYGDPATGQQLLYTYRMEGPDTMTLDLTTRGWRKVIGSDTATLAEGADGVTVRLEKYSSAAWIR